MTYNPASLANLGAYWVGQGGVNLGVVGNAKHCRGYHLGRDRIYGACACKPDGTCEPGLGDADYSVKLARDKAGLTDAASAIDLGTLNGSLDALRDFSVWLVAQARANAPGTSDIREIIYTPDGAVVLRWDRERGYASAPQPGEADNSHLTHTHISYYRDSQSRDKRPVFARYWEAEAMIQVSKGEEFRAKSHPAFPAGNGVLRVAPTLTAAIIVRHPTGKRIGTIGEYRDPTGNQWRQTAEGPTPAWLLYRKADGTSPDWEPTTPGGDPVVNATYAAFVARDPDPTPYGPADLEAAKLDGRRAEWERQKQFAIVQLAAKP